VSELQLLLDGLEQQWRALGVPTERVLAPGLDAAQVRGALMSELGTAPDDLVTWFTWHNGTTAQGWEAAPLPHQLHTLEHCVQNRQEQISIKVSPPMTGWDLAWLPLTDEPVSSLYAFHTRTGQLLLVDWWSAEFVFPAAADLATAVRFWTRVLQGGYYRWVDGAWEYDFASLPLEIRSSSLTG